MSHRIDHKDVSSMDSTRGKYSSGGSTRVKKYRGEKVVRAADVVAPLAASYVTGSLLGAVAYPSIKAAYKNVTGKPGQKRRKERRERRTARRGK